MAQFSRRAVGGRQLSSQLHLIVHALGLNVNLSQDVVEEFLSDARSQVMAVEKLHKELGTVCASGRICIGINDIIHPSFERCDFMLNHSSSY